MMKAWQNLRRAVRTLAKSPGFMLVAVLSLALGIGANTAIFSLLDALLLRRLPVRQPDRLVQLSVVRRGDKIPFSFPMFRELDRGQQVFTGLIGWSFGSASNVDIQGVLSQAEVRSVTGNYYSELGVAPLLGRLISPDDASLTKPGTTPVAVLSFEYWQRRFGGAANVIGREIGIDGHPFTIVGVTRPWFAGMTTGEAPDITVPMKSTEERALLWVNIAGRLKDRVAPAQARAQLESFWPEVLRATVSTQAPGLRRQRFFAMGLDVSPAATGINKALREHFTRPLYVLMGIVALILLVACVNLANLMLARAAARSHESSVRLALGASRWALAWPVLMESLVLSAGGAFLGLVFAYWGSRSLVGFMTEGSLTPVLLDLKPDAFVLAVTTGVAVLAALLFGLVPAWRCSRQDPAAALQQQTRNLAGAMGKLGQSLVIAQVALSLTLLLGAGLLVRSFQKLSSANLGFTTERVLELNLYPRPGGYEKLDVPAYHRQLIEHLASLPGVSSVGGSASSLQLMQRWQDTVSVTGEAATPETGVMSDGEYVSPGFFRTLGVAITQGREFDWSDDAHHPPVAIISSALAKRLFPAGNAIGQHVRFSFMPEMQNLEVIGVANNARLLDLHDAAPPAIYLAAMLDSARGGCYFVRSTTPPEALARSLAREVDSFGHDYVLSTRTVAQEVSRALVEEQVMAMLSGFFAGLALLLASVGLYGLVSYGVTGRTREIGVRMALGAPSSSVLWTVLKEALSVALLGLAIGVPCALAATRLLGRVLFGVTPTDFPTILFASLVLMAVAALAAYLPALRASRIDPMVALRTE